MNYHFRDEHLIGLLLKDSGLTATEQPHADIADRDADIRSPDGSSHVSDERRFHAKAVTAVRQHSPLDGKFIERYI